MNCTNCFKESYEVAKCIDNCNHLICRECFEAKDRKIVTYYLPSKKGPELHCAVACPCCNNGRSYLWFVYRYYH